MLDSVEQTGSSLQRFKKKFAPLSAAAEGQQQSPVVADPDELKIRCQLVFDANFVKQRAVEIGTGTDGLAVAAVERLERIEQRGNVGAAVVAGASGNI